MIARLAAARGLYAMHRAMGFGPVAAVRWAVSVAFTRNVT